MNRWSNKQLDGVPDVPNMYLNVGVVPDPALIRWLRVIELKAAAGKTTPGGAAADPVAAASIECPRLWIAAAVGSAQRERRRVGGGSWTALGVAVAGAAEGIAFAATTTTQADLHRVPDAAMVGTLSKQ
jgi:hypothetical protein